MNQYTGAIFDMDGVLFDTERVFQQSWHEIATEMGVKLPDEYTEAISGTNGEVMCRVIERFYHVPDGTQIMNSCKQRVQKKLSRKVPVKEGVWEILEHFRAKGVRIAVASSSSRAQIQSNLALSGLERFFDVIISGEEVRIGKPNPEIFLRAAEALGCAPSQCYVFEDSKSGIKAGYAAGCATIMVPDLIKPSPDIIPLCHWVFDSLGEALTAIRAMYC